MGFSAAMRKIRSRTSREILLLPACFLILESMLQYRRKPAPCQPTTVSGATTSSDFFQSHQNRRARTPEELIESSQFGPPLTTLEHTELLTKCEVLHEQVLPGSKKPADCPQPEEEKAQLGNSHNKLAS